jgi:hypothetical protein
MRFWHRGMPNQTDTCRHMLGMIHNIRWLDPRHRVKFQHGCEAAFANPDLHWHVEFGEEPLDYLWIYRF